MSAPIVPTNVPFPWFALLKVKEPGVWMFNCPTMSLTLPLFTNRDYANDFLSRSGLTANVLEIPLIATALFILEHPANTGDFPFPFVVVFDPAEPKFDPDHRHFSRADILAALHKARE